MSAKMCGEVGCCWQPCSQMKVFNAWLRGHAIARKERESTLMSFHAFLTRWSVYSLLANPIRVTEGCCWLSLRLACEWFVRARETFGRAFKWHGEQKIIFAVLTSPERELTNRGMTENARRLLWTSRMTKSARPETSFKSLVFRCRTRSLSSGMI